jgi:hypothetical protein
MDAPSFTALALRVIAREASETDRAALDTELAADPARRDEFEQLRITHDVLRTTLPVMQAGRTNSPELPAHRVGELRTAVRQHFGPEAVRERAAEPAAKAGWHIWAHVLRWVFGGGGLAAAIFAVVMFCFANKTIEVGLYKTDLVRGEQGMTAQDLPQAMLIAFDQDAPFDAWQAKPLAWNERAKIWVDNEHDLLYVTHRVRHGQIVTETQPLAPTDAAQREQIKSVVAGLQQ